MNAIARHWQIVRAALEQERKSGRRLFDTKETDFLPAALEIIEKPVSPTARMTAWVMLTFLVITIGWLFIGHVDVVASAPGQIIPASNVKLVQPATGGIVHAILVSDGQHVRAGQPLVEMDPTLSSADVEEVRKTLETARLSAARDRAILNALDGKGFSFATPPDTSPEAAEMFRRLAQSRLGEINASAAQHEADYQGAVAALGEAQTALAKLNQTLPILDQEIAAYEKLLAKGYAPELKVIEMRRQRLASERDRDAAVDTARRARAQMAAARSAQAQDEARARADLLQDLATNEAEARNKQQELVKSSKMSGLQRLVAPVDRSEEHTSELQSH